jgi:hypothetical protein
MLDRQFLVGQPEENIMRKLTLEETASVSGGKKSKVTPVGPKTKTLPAASSHGQETAAAASSKPEKPKKG